MNIEEKYTFINNFIKNLYSIIFINLKIFFYKIILKKKILLFYHPKHLLSKIHNFYIEDLLKTTNKNFKIIYAYNPHYKFKMNISNFHILNQGFLKLIYNIDIFISLNMCEVFPKNSINIYIHHSIYDTPLNSIKKDKILIAKYQSYDHIFLASKDVANIFNYLFKKYNKFNLPKIHEIGYPRLDFIFKNIKNKKIKNKVIIAPTGYRSFPNLSIHNHLIKLIIFLIKSKKYNVVYRPHPSDLKSKEISKIKIIFKNEPLFELDNSINYYNTYKDSKFLITDLSGTAYTYALLTDNPVIFFSKNEKYINKTYYKKLNYFKNRNKIGITINNFKYLKNTIKKLENNRKKHKIEINKVRKNIIFLGKSKKRVWQILNKLI